jgi:ComF family protein
MLYPPILSVFRDAVHLFFPRLCLACDQVLSHQTPYICLDCQATLPETDFPSAQVNAFTARFEGRLTVEAAAALYYFTKQSRTQHLIHEIKYHDKREAAFALGQILGRKMQEQLPFQNLDWILPVPMHVQKHYTRGFNQAAYFADGLSDILQVPVLKNSLQKVKMTDSQTRLTRLERLKNAEDVFACITPPSVFRDKNLLIVDDVMTTGATLESCAHAILQKEPRAKISFAAIAMAEN